MVELVDAADSKSAGFTPLRVQVSLPVPEISGGYKNVTAFLLFVVYYIFKYYLKFLPLSSLHCSAKASSQGPLRETWTTPSKPRAALKCGDHGLFAAKGRVKSSAAQSDSTAMRMIGWNAIHKNIAAWAEMASDDSKNRESPPGSCLADFETTGSKGGI